MRMNTFCLYQHRTASVSFLLCKKQMKGGVNYDDRQNAASVCCLHQHYCPTTGRNENTEEAPKCVHRHKAAE